MALAFLGDVRAWRRTRWRFRFFVTPHQLSNFCIFKRLPGNENQENGQEDHEL
ncbi:hypothetical protein LOK49_LG10G01918 [Camellia lanceoleosa]|uniref:Uncharacterized protein n=1 Tax=Camellia lanceoleosa TaxID=1840588 RepID=A0ACC0G707_9ERIC|nr:hypothetical protein LOK49_LG10G01918 [Camellia lanceoleosa]